MIKQITIRNFQSHKRTVMNLHKGVNIICGQSDSGKSAIMRAINWGITNRPGGDSFRSNWGGDTSVEFVLTDEHTVTRKKNDSNYYVVDDVSFTAFKTDVPDEVTTTLALDDVNIQSQLDAPFLLSCSSGEVAKTLNKIVDLQIIDTTISNIKKEVHSWKTERDRQKQNLSDLESKKTEFSYLGRMGRDLRELETKKSKVDVLEGTEKGINKILTQRKRLLGVVEASRSLLEAELPLKKVVSLVVSLNKLEQDYTRLSNLIQYIKRKQKDLSEYNNAVTHHTDTYKSVMPKECPLCHQKIK